MILPMLLLLLFTISGLKIHVLTKKYENTKDIPEVLPIVGLWELGYHLSWEDGISVLSPLVITLST